MNDQTGIDVEGFSMLGVLTAPFVLVLIRWLANNVINLLQRLFHFLLVSLHKDVRICSLFVFGLYFFLFLGEIVDDILRQRSLLIAWGGGCRRAACGPVHRQQGNGTTRNSEDTLKSPAPL